MAEPITGLGVVADVSRVPSGFVPINRSFDAKEDANLWKDSFFARGVSRYICVTRNPYDNKGQICKVVTDVAVVYSQNDLPDKSWSIVETTIDTREQKIVDFLIFFCHCFTFKVIKQFKSALLLLNWWIVSLLALL